jgi:hypothetical protein
VQSVLDPSFGQQGSALYENEAAMKSFITDKLARLDLILPTTGLTKGRWCFPRRFHSLEGCVGDGLAFTVTQRMTASCRLLL